MKRTQLLHAELSGLIASMGHGDMLVIGDVGLPIPTGAGGPLRIDLALSPGIPGVQQVLQAVLSELHIERAVLAQEALDAHAGQRPAWCSIPAGIALDTVSHQALKAMCSSARAVVRTGECTPYANIVLVAGVTF